MKKLILAALLLSTVGLMAQGTIPINYTYTARVENGVRWLHEQELARIAANNADINNVPLPVPTLGQYAQALGSNVVDHAFQSYALQAEADAGAKLVQREKYLLLIQTLREANDAKRDAILDAAIAVANQ